ncbi:MAG: hypothetical protein JXQ68_05160, partial [Campylobacterales bacterium]|nr:hypothetical protein [Campylobacterales bacterium]
MAKIKNGVDVIGKKQSTDKKNKEPIEKEEAQEETTEDVVGVEGGGISTNMMLSLGALALGGLAAAAGGGGGGSNEEAAVTDEGYLLSTEIRSDEDITYIATHSYDANGYETEVTGGEDTNGNLLLDGDEVEGRNTYTYDSVGNMLSRSYDYDGDG